ncbi:MAG: alpha/beta fold hydrolase [Planctomycetota bacterium]
MLGLFELLAVGLVVAMAIGIHATIRTLMRPPRRTYSWAVARGKPGDPRELTPARQYQSWTFTSRGAALPVWDIVGDKPQGPIVVITFGWGDARVTMLQRAGVLARSASRVILWDLPGHGESPREASFTLGTHEHEDLLALLASLTQAKSGEASPKIVLYGFSLGAGVSIVAAAHSDCPAGVAGVIAEAPYRVPATPARNVLRQMGMPFRWNLPVAMACISLDQGKGLAWRGFDRAAHAAVLKVPLLVIHGTQDPVCPIEDGDEIARVAGGEFVAIEGGGHLDLWNDERAADAIADWLRRLA